MAKMFYTLEEVCQKLGKTDEEVREMASSGQIQEFRDRDRLMFKVEQIDLLAGGEDDASEVHLELEDSKAGSGLGIQAEASGGGSGIPLSDSREETGISVFDTGHGEEDAADRSDAPEAAQEEDLSLDAVGSGSGLLDLTRESDETSLGAELLEEAYTSEEAAEIPAGSGLFEAAGIERTREEVPEPAGVIAPMVVEAYDGAASGLGAGLLIGAMVSLVCVAIIAITGVGGATPDLAARFGASTGSLWIWAGGLFGITLILGLIGLFVGKASE
jgi:hypothetical protein